MFFLSGNGEDHEYTFEPKMKKKKLNKQIKQNGTIIWILFKDGLKMSKCEWPLSFEGKLVLMIMKYYLWKTVYFFLTFPVCTIEVH